VHNSLMGLHRRQEPADHS